MKKFLSLVLALVMTMSLVTISAGAEDFTDDASITYGEAVDVMSAVGVVGGYADGSFNPTAGLTRGAAAKIICNMILGPTTASALSANDAPYKDVPADNTFAGYIAYCANEGIISGYADGTFRPAAPLTGYAFMKMLLGALGYDASIEGYTGTNWSIQVAKRALNIGLDDGLEGDFVGSKALNREEACLYAFNALTATMVDYDNNSQITVGDIVITNKSKAEEITISSEGAANYAGGAAGAAGLGTQQFCEVYFAKLKLQATVDNYKSASNKWSYKGVTVGSYKGDSTLVYTDELKADDIKADLEDYNNYGSATPVALFENGKESTIAVTAAAIAAKTGNGTVVEVYVSDNGVTKVVVIESVVAEVTAISDKNETITLSVKASGTTFGDTATTLTTDKGYGDFAKKDLVLVTAYNAGSNDIAGATVTSVKALEVVEGLATKKNSAKDTITLDGAAYEAAENIAAANNVAAFAVSSKYDATLYLDEYGYVVYAKSGAASTNDKAVAVLKAYSTLNEDGEIVGVIKGVTSDGETVVWETESAYPSADLNKVRVYSDADDDDKYDFAVPAVDTVAKTAGIVNDGQTVATSSSTIAASDKTMTIGGTKLYYSENVKFIFVNDGKATVKDGVQKVTALPCYVTIDVVDDVPYITAVYVRGGAANTTVSANDIVLVKGGVTGSYDLTDKDGKTKTFKTYDAYIAGVQVESFYSDNTVSTTGFYEVEIDNDNGDYKLASANVYGTGDNGALSVSAEDSYADLVGNVLSTASADYDISSATFVDTTGNDYTSFAEVHADKNDAGSSVAGAKFVVVYDYDTGVASYVYLTQIL